MSEMQFIGFGSSASDLRQYAFHSASGREENPAMMQKRFRCNGYVKVVHTAMMDSYGMLGLLEAMISIRFDQNLPQGEMESKK
jgi:hypothetical protein